MDPDEAFEFIRKDIEKRMMDFAGKKLTPKISWKIQHRMKRIVTKKLVELYSPQIRVEKSKDPNSLVVSFSLPVLQEPSNETV